MIGDPRIPLAGSDRSANARFERVTELVSSFSSSQIVSPKLVTIPVWMKLSGYSRTRVFAELATGQLRAKKLGRRTLIDLEHGMKRIAALPDATYRPAQGACSCGGDVSDNRPMVAASNGLR